MVRGIRRLQRWVVLAGTTLGLLLIGCGADEASVGGPNKPAQPMEKLSTGQIASVVVTINQIETQQAQAVVGRIEDASVRAFIDTILVDHRDADAELASILSKMGVQQEASGLRTEIEQLARKLDEMVTQSDADRVRGTSLDAQIRMHRKSVGSIDQLLAQVQEPELRTYIEEFRSTEQQHLEQAVQLRKRFRDTERER
jgi:predicted outer membrane protein